MTYTLGQIWQHYDWHTGRVRRGMIVGFLGTRPIMQYLRGNGMFGEGRTVVWRYDLVQTTTP